MKTNWQTKKLKDVCKINPTKSELRDMSNDTMVAFVPMSAVDEVTQQIKRQESKKYGDVKKGYTYFKKGDILFAKITPCMENGKVAFSDNLEREIGFASTEFHILRAGADILPAFVFHIVKSKKFREEAEQKMTGTAGQKRVPKSFIENYEIPLPPLEVQKKIVAKLESLLAKVSEAKKLRAEARESADNLLSAELHKIFAEGKNKGWEEKNIGDPSIMKMTSGGTPSKGHPEYYGGDIKWLKSGELEDNENIVDSEDYITEEGLKKSSTKLFPSQTVLLAMYGATAGKLGILGVEASTNQAVAGMVCKPEKLHYKFLFYSLMRIRDEIIADAWGGAQPNLSQTIIKRFSVVLPPISEQKKIVDRLDALSQKIEAVKELQNTTENEFGTLESSVLSQAFSG